MIRVKAPPDHPPHSIEYSIDSLVDFDAVIKVSDLTIPGDVTLLTDPDEVVAKVLQPRLQVEEAALEAEEAEAAAAEAAEAGEGEAAAEGGAAEGAAAGEGEAAPSEGTAES